MKAYGVWQALGLTSWNIARPALFLIDRQRTIRYSFISARQDHFPSHEEIVDAITRSGLTPDESAGAYGSRTP